MAGLIYGLCAATAILCASLLLRNYSRSKSRLILWSGLCFVGLSLSNLLLVADRLLFPNVDLSILRLSTSLTGMVLLLYGLIWETE